MTANQFGSISIRAGLVASMLLAAGGAFAQSTVTLTASPQNATLPDGQIVPMWGFTCGDSASPAVASVNATCTAMTGSAQSGGAAWQPPLITVPAGMLTITLDNQLTFTTGTGSNTVPTSLVIVGQLGGGLGDAPARMPSPPHAPQGTTWPGTLGGIDPATAAITVTTSGAGYVNPPSVTISGGGGSGAAAVAYLANGTVSSISVSSVGSGYTSAPTVTIDPPPCTISAPTCVRALATMNVSILASSDGSPTFVPPAQADRVRSFGTEVAAGAPAPTALVWNNLRPGTYLIESGTQPSIQGPMGLYGVLVVTEPDVGGAHVAYGTTFDAAVPLLLSEIDPMQNAAVDTAVRTTGFSDQLVWDGQTGMCGDPIVHTCYPPAVNYSPLYYLINGGSFDATHPAASAQAVAAAGPQGRVLLRLVNAGLRMHVPSVVGATMTLLAEDGNKLPGKPRLQNEVFLAAGKTYDVTIQPKQTTAGTYDAATYALFDRALGVSTNNQADGGMQAYLQVAGGALPTATTLTASDKTYYCVAGAPLAITDPAKGLLAGATGANGVALGASFTGDTTAATVALNANGTFTYTPSSGSSCGGTFQFLVNGTKSQTATVAECDATTQASGCSLAAAPVVSNIQFTSNVATRYQSPPPGVLGGVTSNPGGLTLTAVGGAGVTLNADGSFVATNAAGACPPGSPAGAVCTTFQYQAKNAQGTLSNAATATVVFLAASNLVVNVKDALNGVAVTDYRWIIEEDKTFWIDPQCQINSKPVSQGGLRPDSCSPLPVESLGYSFHTANMPVVAQGCVGAISCEAGQTLGGVAAVCDVGNGVCRTDGTQQAQLLPGAVHLDPNKRYFLSVLPGDGVNPTIGGAGGPDANGKPFTIASACGPYNPGSPAWEPGGSSAMCGHAMGGSQVAAGQTSIDIKLQQTPLPTAKIAVFVFQDDNPLNGENDAGGGIDVIAPNEAGLGGFEIKLFDQAGGLGDATGQITYDMFNQPVSNSLAGHVDPLTGLDACPITARTDGLVGMIPTCPKFESDGVTPSPLEGQAVIANLYPGLYEIQAYPAADRIGRGEEWLQTNTLDGGKPHEAFIKPNEPGYFQEFGPGGFHVSIGFANPAIINGRKASYCDPTVNPSLDPGGCKSTLNVQVTNAHMSRTPDQRTYSSETYDHYSFTQCYVSIGPADAPDFAFQKCSADGKVSFTGMPNGVFKITVFDQWNDIMLDGLVGTVSIAGNTGNSFTTSITFPVTQWRTDLYTRTFIDTNGDGVSQPDEPGLALVNTNIHYRDGSIGFFNNTDLNGYAGFNEVFPFMNWLVVETSSTRFKPTGVHTVYDAGGPVDCSNQANALNYPCSTIAANIANTAVRVPLPADLRLPGAKYCDTADCLAGDLGTGISTGTIFPPMPWGTTQGWQGLLGQNSFMEFGVKPFKPADAGAGTPAENGGISGMVIYASTRPFDDPALSLQLQWEPGVPRVKVNLYKKEVDESANEKLTLVDSTTTASWDDWAQGFRTGPDGTTLLTAGTGAQAGFVPNMNCPGQDATSPFFATLKNSKQWLDTPDANGNKKALAYSSQFKCFDGWAQLNQIQPAPYDGLYKFPSIVAVDATGKSSKTNCTSCVTNPDDGTPMLPAGKYVVEVILPPGYELVKEEDKNILLGDVYVAPVTQQFAGFGNIFIMPDQAAVNASYNPNNPGGLDKTTDLGAKPRHEGDTGSVEQFWPCVGAERIVPDLNSLFPGAGQAAPFAGAKRRLCDRKEVDLKDEGAALTKFFVFSSTHIAGHFTGLMTNDFASEFDPFSPQFGEKFGPPNLPVAMRDFNGNEVARVYADQWGVYNGLYFSTYGVNPPNPTGYVPQMSIACMNDPGPILVNGQWITDPSYSPAYSNFCYEMPFMPGFTAYMDTPVIPTQAFADQYNLPDSEYPDGTPAIKSVVSTAAPGPWVPNAGTKITITALGNKDVQNPNFSGPNASVAPFNQKTITRRYSFGNSAGTVALVGSDGVARPLTGVSWSDTVITGNVPSNLPNCTVQQRGVATSSQCGELVITRGDNGKRSIDAITVTVGGSAPWVVTANSVDTNTGGTVVAPAGKSVKDYTASFGRMFFSPIQTAIDSASPGDLILIQPGVYRENLLMWKPVRLQGVGAGSVTINADAHPAGKLDSWRRQVNCAFGLTLDGAPNPGNTGFIGIDPTNSGYVCPAAMHQRVDRIPFESIVGWDASGNGNLAQVLQEPTLMGAYEGAGITVLGRGIRIPAGETDFWGTGTVEATFPNGSVWLTQTGTDCNTASTTRTDGLDYGTSNYLCNPSLIDGVSVINSSQGGGGVFVHGWAHNLEVANTRISGNHGTLAGAINLGNGETPDSYVNDGVACGITPVSTPCPPINNKYNRVVNQTNVTIPFQFNTNVRLHHNMLYNNASIGDALFSGTPAGAGAITVSAGADGYQIDHNWIAGNLSTGDGGGLQHLGLSFKGKINNNYVLFNQSTNPTLPTSGGGIVIEGANLDRVLNGTECGSTADQDCPPGLSEGTGGSLVIDSNLILGNSAESGTGGGLRIQQVNGSELVTFMTDPRQWYDVAVTNNIIANNVAGWDGGGVSLQDALRVTLVNNTVVSNDTTASAGVLFKTLGAIMANTPPPGCTPTTDPSLPQDPSCTGADAPHGPQPAGLVTQAHTPNLIAAIGAQIVCPNGSNAVPGLPSAGVYPYSGAINGDCRQLSKPAMVNDLFFQNRAFAVNVVNSSGAIADQGNITDPTGTGLQSQQNLVAITPALNQTATGQCPAGANYWDIGLRTDDLVAGTIPAGTKLALTYSIYTGDPQGVITTSATNVVGGSSPVIAPFCNGARTAPESCSQLAGGLGQSCNGYNAPPGASETTGLATVFVFNGIKPTATVDEGHNWLNLSYGPLTLNRSAVQPASTNPPELMLASASIGSTSGAYSIGSTSSAVNRGSNSGINGVVPTRDFFGNPRPLSGTIDIGAVEFQGTVTPVYTVSVTPNPVAFGNWATGTTSTATVTVTNAGNASLSGLTYTTAAPFSVVSGGTCGATLNVGASCTVRVQFAPTTATTSTGSLTVASTTANTLTPTSTVLTGTGVAARSVVAITPNPLTINLASNQLTNSGTVTFTNTAALGGAQVAVTNVSVTGSGGSLLQGTLWAFTKTLGQDQCTGVTLAPGQACTVGVSFSSGTSRSTNRSGSITFTDNAQGSPQTGTLSGVYVTTVAAVP